MISAKTQIAAAAAVIALSASVSAVPTYGDYLEARGPVVSKLANTAAESAAGKAASHLGRQATKVGLEIGQRKMVDAANQKIKDHIEAKKHNHGKRSFDDILEELMARGPVLSKMANTAAESAAGKAASHLGRQATKVGLEIGQRKMVDAANQKIKDHIEAKKHNHGKRSFDDVLEELMARGPVLSKMANTAAESAAGKAASHLGRQATKVGLEIGQRKMVDAANQKIKDHIEAKKHNHGKRSFDDVLEELMARGPVLSKMANTAAESAAGKAASHLGRQATKVGLEIGQRKMVDAANQKIKDHIEAKKHNHAKRELVAALVDYIEARAFELDDLE